MKKFSHIGFDYLRLLRLQTGAATTTTPILGALVMGQRNIEDFIILFFIALFYHIFGFVLNEYADIEVDKKSVDLNNKPLVKGSISKNSALTIISISLLITIILTVNFYFNIYSVSFLFASLFFGAIYDVFGKRIPGSDFILGVSFFFLCLIGASTISHNFNTLVFVISFIYYIQISFNNSVEGGLKDADHDTLAGAKTLASKMGVTVINKRVIIPVKFRSFAIFLRLLFIVGVVYILLSLKIMPNFDQNILYTSILIFLLIVQLVTLRRFLLIEKFDRAFLKRLFSIHEIASYFLVIFALFPLFGTDITIILLLFPSIWYLIFNVLLYGKVLQPQV